MATQPITRLLLEWSSGNELALEQLMPLVHGELRKIAATYLSRERAGHTLQPTALVNEAYLRLVAQGDRNWENRSHFLGVAAHLMRLILVDSARKANAGKRGARARQVTLADIVDDRFQQPCEDLMALDDALTELDAVDPRKTKIIELRYFGGMTVDEVARSLSLSTSTVERETRFAQLWLCRRMKSSPTL